MRTITVTALALLCFAAVPDLAVAQTGHDLFQQALVKERADGDLRGAIEIYERIAREFTSDRTLAARALVQLGRCFEKLGSTEAERAYQRVVREFSDQDELVLQARSRLAVLQRAAQAAEGSGITTRQVQVIPLAGIQIFGPTPDGEQLLYVDWDNGNLAIRDTRGGKGRFLTTLGSWEDPEQYVWGGSASPDGQTVAYLVAEVSTSSLHSVRIDGSDHRVLYRREGAPVGSHAWIGDNGQIVALAGEQILLISVADGTDLALEGPESLAPRKVSASTDYRHATLQVAVAGDGDNGDIWTIALDGAEAVPLVQHPADDRLLGSLPGTNDVLFLSDRNGRWDLWAIRVTDGQAEARPRMVRPNVGQPATGGWEPLGITEDGSLFYSVYTRWFSTSVAPFDPTTETADEESATAILGSNFGATWSPDGEYVAVVNEQVRSGGPDPGPYRRPLHVHHLATGVERELASDVHARMPRWSRDGRFILMNGRDEANQSPDYHGGLYKVDVESGEATAVLELEGETKTPWWYGISGVWSAESDAIIYSQYYGNVMEGRLVWRELESGRERLLYRDSLLTTRLLALSPDGNRLVFGVRDSLRGGGVASISAGGRLMIMDLAEGEPRELYHIHEPGTVGSLQWTPDGGHVLFSRTEEVEERRTGVWRVPAEGGTAERLWNFGEGHFGGRFSLSPDGSHVAFHVYTQEREVFVMENLKAALVGNSDSGRRQQ